jgi:uncharacterized membrane protein YphA (DoxX/SURF4 family)
MRVQSTVQPKHNQYNNGMASKNKIKNHTSSIPNTYNPAIASLLIRVGLAAVFLYAGVDAFKHPQAWISYIPAFSTHFLDAKTSLDIISVIQILLAGLLISGQLLKLSALVAISFFAGLLVFNLDTFLITFRDIGLIGAAAALLFLDD